MRVGLAGKVYYRITHLAQLYTECRSIRKLACAKSRGGGIQLWPPKYLVDENVRQAPHKGPPVCLLTDIQHLTYSSMCAGTMQHTVSGMLMK